MWWARLSGPTQPGHLSFYLGVLLATFVFVKQYSFLEHVLPE